MSGFMMGQETLAGNRVCIFFRFQIFEMQNAFVHFIP